jgi:hypothetical protein
MLVLAEANGTLITGTAATQVLSYIAPRRGLYRVTPYLEVANAATVVTLTATWTDPVLGAQTYTWQNAANLAVGTYPQSPQLVRAQGGTAITVTVTAGTANNVTASAIIEGRA